MSRREGEVRASAAIAWLVAVLALAPSAGAQDWGAWRERLEAERVQLETLLEKSGRLIEQVEAIELQRRAALEALPAGIDTARLLESLSRLAVNCGAELRAFAPGERRGRAPVEGLHYRARLLVARLADAACVAAGLVRLERILTLDGLEVDTGSGPAEARLDLTAWVFRPEPKGSAEPVPPPAALPAGAPADLVRLQAEVAGLRARAARVKAMIERSRHLRAGLGAVAELKRLTERQQALGPMFRALVNADPHPGRLRFSGHDFLVAGLVRDPALLALIREAHLPDGFTLKTKKLSVRPEPARVNLDSLPDLDGGRAAGRAKDPLVIYALEADPLAVRAGLRAGDRPLVLVGEPPERLTGRIRAGDARRALTALIATSAWLQPDGRLQRAMLRGRGRRVSLQFFHADARGVLRLLAEVGRIDLIVPGELPEVSILARNQPWDGVVEAIAAGSGRRVERRGQVWYLLVEGQALPEVSAPHRSPVDLRPDSEVPRLLGPEPDARSLIGRLRLSATLTGQGQATAVLEDDRTGAVRIVRDGGAIDAEHRSLVRVEPGRVEIRWRDDPTGAVRSRRVLYLRKRS